MVFRPEDYFFMPDGESKNKLISSAVAPLVALARGYEVATKDNKEKIEQDFDIKSPTHKRQLEESLIGEALMMPWYGIHKAERWLQKGEDASFTTYQIRPSVPISKADDSMKTLKYVNPARRPTTIDVHPGISLGTFTKPAKIYITEGILKADSLLTAWMKHTFFPEWDFKIEPETTPAMARIAIKNHFQKTHEKGEDILILSLVGVNNWAKCSEEFLSLYSHDAEIVIAFDADMSTNLQVWNAARRLADKMRKRSKKVSFLHLPRETGEKAGIDDFFAQGKTYSDLLQYETSEMPPRPVIEGEKLYRQGQWRLNEDGTQILEMLEDGGLNAPAKIVANYGAKIKNLKLCRFPLDEEMESGLLDEDKDAKSDPEAVCDIEFKYKRNNEIITGHVYGTYSQTIALPPASWAKSGAIIENSVLESSSGWNPSPKLSQMLASENIEDREYITTWKRMGWVPDGEGNLEFLCGRQRISADGIYDDGKQYHTVDDWTGELFSLAKTNNLNADIDRLREVFLENTWSKKEYGPLMLSVMLAPAIPQVGNGGRAVPYFCGEPKSGKTWSASALMGGWGNFRLGEAVGSAADTRAATRVIASRIPIWLIDDLAASTSVRKFEQQAATIEEIVRSSFNNAAYKKMGVDHELAEDPKPYALLLITAEIESNINSIASRVLMIPCRKGMLKNLNDMEDLIDDKISQKVIGEFIRWICLLMFRYRGWKILAEELKKLYKKCEKIAQEEIQKNLPLILEGDTVRPAKAIAPYMAVLHLFNVFALEKRNDKLVKDFTDIYPTSEAQIRLIAKVQARAQEEREKNTLGKSLLLAVSQAMRSGKAYVTSLSNAGEIPDFTAVDPTELGWRPNGNGGFSANGTKIGQLAFVDEDKKPILLLIADDAFRVAQSGNRELLPTGTSKNSAWQAVWDENLAFSEDKGGWRQAPGRLSATIKESNRLGVEGGGGFIRRIPILLDEIAVLSKEQEETFL